MPSFTKADSLHHAEVLDRVGRILSAHHGDLLDAEVTIGVLMSHTPVKLHGYPCAATIKVTGLEQRVLGVPDAVIKIDAATWEDLSDAERDALVDHELHHLELQHDKEGHLRADDHGRPVLKMRLHDVQVGWFLPIAERHGAASFEVKQAREIYGKHYQQLFRWTDDSAPAPAPSGMELLFARELFECEDCKHRRPCTDHPCPVCESSSYRVVAANPATDEPPAGMAACGRCHKLRPMGVHPCPDCGGTEYRLSRAEMAKGEAEKAGKRKARGSKGRKAAAEVSA